jgi:hypothetical protein
MTVALTTGSPTAAVLLAAAVFPTVAMLPVTTGLLAVTGLPVTRAGAALVVLSRLGAA